MKLIKINTDHYIIVDDSEIKEGDWYIYNQTRNIEIKQDKNDAHGICTCKKITHSTQPLNDKPHFAEYGLITLSEVKELIGEVDVEKKAERLYPFAFSGIGNSENDKKEHWIKGYNQALEDNKEKKYTEKDVINGIIRAYYLMGEKIDVGYFDEVIKSFQPKTEWEVEFIDGKLKFKP